MVFSLVFNIHFLSYNSLLFYSEHFIFHFKWILVVANPKAKIAIVEMKAEAIHKICHISFPKPKSQIIPNSHNINTNIVNL